MPTKLILQPANVAIPVPAVFTGLVVQVSVAPAVPVPLVIASVTGIPAVVTALLFASSTVTLGCVVNAVPAAEGVLGSVVKTNWVAVPGVMLKALLVADVSPVLEAVSV